MAPNNNNRRNRNSRPPRGQPRSYAPARPARPAQNAYQPAGSLPPSHTMPYRYPNYTTNAPLERYPIVPQTDSRYLPPGGAYAQDPLPPQGYSSHPQMATPDQEMYGYYGYQYHLQNVPTQQQYLPCQNYGCALQPNTGYYLVQQQMELQSSSGYYEAPQPMSPDYPVHHPESYDYGAPQFQYPAQLQPYSLPPGTQAQDPINEDVSSSTSATPARVDTPFVFKESATPFQPSKRRHPNFLRKHKQEDNRLGPGNDRRKPDIYRKGAKSKRLREEKELRGTTGGPNRGKRNDEDENFFAGRN
ncbi:uncharacterized protein K460DRAFT_416834 [Cucurbitaria berberidis CBS 394.84]|uniref:Uncharacterized protein n=1 Tax=Cucurbitaria berberidis CBS 394.84 TaxID=1168544 RepID=A0A9P4L827_9PLEO|nr:uncharacterized protein K460DRAFT_416834 [Cucurbitaria berberidis CBS 394.84]KAF1845601.1 hypothetical protein K460DRAFT_416834 [Cucurbitaria berberidis CBS 394.84]